MNANRPKARRVLVGIGSVLIAGLCFATYATAVEVEMEIQPQVVSLGESCTLRLIVRDAQGLPPPRLPPMNGFEIVSTGTEQSFRFENGRRSAQTAFTFQLTPQAAGDYQIGPFRYDAGGTVVDIPGVRVQVLARNAAASGENQRIDDLLFAVLSADRPSVYVQETFDLTISLYSQPGLNLDRNVGLLDFDTRGLTIDGFEEQAGGREVINGIPYNVRRFRTRATALTAGTFTLSPKLRVNVIVPRSGNRSRDPFFGDSFFDSFFNRVETHPYSIEAKPLTLEARDIPKENRPSTFTGAVGTYSFDVHINPTDVRIGDPVTLTLRVQGRGRMESIQAPVLNLPYSFRSYEPRLIEQEPATGLKTFEQVIIPRTMAATGIPAIAFSYFDPAAGRFETIVRGPFPLSLAAAPNGGAAAETINPPRQTRDADLGTDLVYLKPAPKRWTRIDDSHASFKTFLSVNALPALGMLLAFMYSRQQRRRERNPAAMRRRQAPRQARAGLTRCRALLQKGDLAGAAQTLSDTMQQFFGPLLNLPPGQITTDEVCKRMEARGLPMPELELLRTVFMESERLRFARQADPTQAIREFERIVDQMSNLLVRCQQVVR